MAQIADLKHSSWRLPLAMLCAVLSILPGIVFFGMVPALPGIILSKIELDHLAASGAPATLIKLARAVLILATCGGAASIIFLALGFFAGTLKLLGR